MKIQVVMLSAFLLFMFSVASVSALKSWDLTQGWNMISFPYGKNNITQCTAYNASSSNLRTDQYNSLSSLYNYNPTTDSYDVISLSNMYDKEIKGKAFWIYKSSPGECVLSIKAIDVGGKSKLSLKTRWNQIATPIQGMEIEKFKGDCNILGGPWEFDAIQNKYVYSNYLEQEKGYWLYVNSDCTLFETCEGRGGTCRAWDPINGNCNSNEKRDFPSGECENNILQNNCCVPK